MGRVYLRVNSAKVLPRHILCPPRNGVNARGFLFPPSGLRKYSDSGLNLSGMNSSGFYHWSLSLCMAPMLMKKASFGSNGIPLIVQGSVTELVDETENGVSSLMTS